MDADKQSKMSWKKATRSGAAGHCAEVSENPAGGMYLRDSKDNGQGPVLSFTPDEWNAFVGGVKDGEFDL